MDQINNSPFEKINKSFQMCGWSISESTYLCLSDYEKSFLELEFTGVNSLGYYKIRLGNVGFTNHNRVLDVGCGMGQWSIALSNLNTAVMGTDINVGRLFVGKDIAKLMSISNLSF